MKLTTEEMILGGLALCAFAAVLAKAIQHRRILRNAHVREPDGTLRALKRSESRAIAESLAVARGSHFWHLLLAGMLVVAVAWLVLKATGHLGTGQ